MDSSSRPEPVQRVLLILTATLVVLLGARLVLRELAPPEARIERRLRSMAESFNDATMRGVMRGFADEYGDEESGYDRDTVKSVLVHLFFQRIDPSTRSFALSVDIPEESLVIRLDTQDPTRAEVTLRAVFTETKRGASELFWDARVSGVMREQEGRWRLVSTSGVNHGERPRR